MLIVSTFFAGVCSRYRNREKDDLMKISGQRGIQDTVSEQIINGSAATPGDWPWIVGLYTAEDQSHCGGVLISNQFVLTAAHCYGWIDLEVLFGRGSSVLSSIAAKVYRHIDSTFGILLSDLNVHRWLDVAELERMSRAVHAKGAPLTNCWGFIDGTARAICRPSRGKEDHFSGHKRHHVLKYQSVMCANGIICDLDGPYRKRRHDAGMLRGSLLFQRLRRLVQGHSYVLYGDPAYPMGPLLLKPYATTGATAAQLHFNKEMSTVRQAVEWGFGKIVAEFAFVDLKKKQKILKQRVARMYKVATLLTNCHTCLYGSQVTSFFDLDPPTLQEYLNSVPTV